MENRSPPRQFKRLAFVLLAVMLLPAPMRTFADTGQVPFTIPSHFSTAAADESEDALYCEDENEAGKYYACMRNLFRIYIIIGITVFVADQLIDNVLAPGGENSDLRVFGKGRYLGLSTRQPGEVLLPGSRYALEYGDMGSGDKVAGLRFEAGYGRTGLELRYSRFDDGRMHPSLDLYQGQFLYRMSFGNYIGVNLGLGVFAYDGADEHGGWLFSLPVTLRLSRDIFGELRMASLSDSRDSWIEREISILYSPRWHESYRNWVLRAGYRELDAGRDSLHIPYLGLEYIF